MLVVNTELGYYMGTQIQEDPITGKREQEDSFAKDLNFAKGFNTVFLAVDLAKQIKHVANVRIEYVKGFPQNLVYFLRLDVILQYNHNN